MHNQKEIKELNSILNRLKIGFIITIIGAFLLFIISFLFAVFVANVVKLNGFIVTVLIYFILSSLISIIVSFKYLFYLFPKINSATNKINRKNEKEFFEILDEITEELELKSLKNVYIENHFEVYIEYENQVQSLLFPQNFSLVVGIGVLQNFSREELKSYLKHELSSVNYSINNKVEYFNSWEKSMGFMLFGNANETQKGKPFIIKLAYLYIFFAEFFLKKYYTKFSEKLDQYKQITNEIIEKKDDDLEFKQLLNEIKLLKIIQNYVEYYFKNISNKIIYSPNSFEIITEINKRLDLKNAFYQIIYLNLNTEFKNLTINEFDFDKKLFKLNQQKEFEELFSTYTTGEINCTTIKFTEDLAKNIFSTTLPDFFNKLEQLTKIDYEEISYSYSDKSISVMKDELLNERIFELIENAINIQEDIISFVHSNENDQNRYNKLNDEYRLIVQEIDKYLENLYVYLKTNQTKSSLPILEEILELEKMLDEKINTENSLRNYKESIYTELNGKKVKEKLKSFDKEYKSVITSLKNDLENDEFKEILAEEIINYLKKEAKDDILYFEKGIYYKEGFEQIIFLSEWNTKLTYLLEKKRKKEYFTLNKEIL